MNCNKSKLVSLTFVFFSMLLFTACPEPEKLDSLSVNPTSLTFSADDPEEKTLTITTDAPSWSYSKIDWVTFRENGNSLYVKVHNYSNTSEPRTAEITFTAGDASPKKVSIEQNHIVGHSLSVSHTSLLYDSNETGDKTVLITTNAPSWNATIDGSGGVGAVNQSWINLAKQANSLIVTVKSESNQMSERSAIITVNAGNAPEQKITVTQKGTGVITFNHLNGYYYGNALKTGTELFILDIFNSSNTNTGLIAMGFYSLQSNSANFSLPTGKYNVANTGASRTLVEGDTHDNNFMGTFVYDNNNYTNIKSGTLSIESSGNIHTITTNFAGEDSKTGEKINNINIKYNGTIQFEDRSKPFDSNYSAAGTPSIISNPSSWSGIVLYKVDNPYNFYQISNWGNSSYSLFLDYINGKLIIDDYSLITTSTSDSNFKFYFGAYTISGGEGEKVNNYEVHYDGLSRIISFGSTHNGKALYVGLFAEYGTEIKLMYAYTNARIILSSTNSAPQFFGEPLDMSTLSGLVIEEKPLTQYPKISKTVSNTKSDTTNSTVKIIKGIR